MIKAIDLDINQTKFSIEEQKTYFDKNEKNEKNEKHAKNEKNEKNEKNDKNGDNLKIYKENNNFFHEETEASMRESILVLSSSYPVDEQLKTSEKSYECYACIIF